MKVNTVFFNPIKYAKPELKYIREGNAQICKGRSIQHMYDGSENVTEWQEISRITNYGDVYDVKPTLWEEIKKFLGLGQ